MQKQSSLPAKLHKVWRSTKEKLPSRMQPVISKIESKTVNAMYTVLFHRRTKKLTNAAVQTAWKSDKEYQDYIEAQVHKSDRHSLRWMGNISNGLAPRTVALIGLMKRHIPKNTLKGTVLCVGCRNAHELNYMEKTCGVKTVGLDLFSDDKRIVVGDMHNMPFKDDEFDGLYSCHNLEHAYDVKKALNEFARVVKSGGFIVIEVPVDFKTSKVDRWDLKTPKKIAQILGKKVKKVLYDDVITVDGAKNGRIILQIRK